MNKNKQGSVNPPLGLMPKWIHDKKRFYEVCKAISNYYTAGLPIDIEWVKEYNDLLPIVKTKR